MGKIKCLKLKCPQCGLGGLAQVFLNADGRVRYVRVRHYKGLNESRTPQFEYHKVSDVEAVKDLLKSEGISVVNSKAETGSLGQKPNAQIYDLKPKDSSLKQQNMRLGSLARWGVTLVR